MQVWAIYWHLRALTDQPMVFSGIGLARFLPVMALSLLAGVAADRTNRRYMAILTQFSRGIMALLLGCLTSEGGVTIWILFGTVTLHSIAVAFDVPARQALIPSLVPREDLANAYSLNSIASKVGGILGPALSGVVIAIWGLEWTYWINAISYTAVIVSLIAMGDVHAHVEKKKLNLKITVNEIQEGLSFILNSPIIFSIIILDFFGTFFSSAKTLLPFVAIDILHVGPIQYGWLSASQASGAVLVGLYISQSKPLRRQGMLICVSVAMFGLATILFGVSKIFWLTMLALILMGILDGLSGIIRNTSRQMLTPEPMRGRMISISQIFLRGGPQLGEVESGLVAQILGVPFAIISGGIGCLVATWIVVKKIPQLWFYKGDE
jgi:MFS family permease